MEIFKKILMVVLILIAVFLVLTATVFTRQAWESYKWQKSVDEWEESLRKPYQEDIYGGATPEETWGMFLDALKAGDIELASKYFAVENQSEEKKFLLREQQLDNLQLVIEQFSFELKKEKDYLQGEKTYFYYELKDKETGEIYNNSVVFYLNPYTKVWKILVL